MKFFLDSAKMDEIEYAYKYLAVDGITTNPKHIKNSGKPFMTAISDIAAFVEENGLTGWEKFPVSVEIDPALTEAKDMVAMARKVAPLSPNFVIKIPCIEQGLVAARELEKEGIRTNVTLVFSPMQALWAAKAGALFVSPFIGWKESNGEDCRQYIDDIVTIYSNYGYLGKTEIICAAVRTGKQIVDCAVSGADIITAGLDVLKESIKHPYTRDGIERFIGADVDYSGIVY